MSFVYFLQTDPPLGPIKIGWTSRRAKDRASKAQTFSATEVAVLAEVPGTKAMEKRLHDHFWESRIRPRGELFRRTPELVDLIEFLAEGGMLESFLGPG